LRDTFEKPAAVKGLTSAGYAF